GEDGFWLLVSGGVRLDHRSHELSVDLVGFTLAAAVASPGKRDAPDACFRSTSSGRRFPDCAGTRDGQSSHRSCVWGGGAGIVFPGFSFAHHAASTVSTTD